MRACRRRVEHDERGVALVTVLGMAAILIVMVTMGLALSSTASTRAASNENWDAAGAAAYAGISDYQSRLTNDNTYQKYGDPTAPFSQATGSTTLVLPTGTLQNPAFDWRPGGSWAQIPNAAGNRSFRYEIDNSAYATQGVIRVLSTGRAGTVTRSILASVRQKGFIDFLYFTDYEVQDPAITGKSQSLCERYYPVRQDSDCGGAIQFGTNEVVDGPLHSNDALYICGGDFKGPVTTWYKTSPYYRNCGSATFEQGPPAPADKMVMPPTNTQMKQETRGDLTTTDVPRPGCLYTGPTSIVFNSDGTMTVRSPWTQYTNTSATGGMQNAACGTPGRGTNNGTTLGSDAGQRIPVPAQNLIYVQTIPALNSDPNYWAPGTVPYTGFACPANGNGIGYPYKTTTGTNPSVSGTTTTETITATAQGTNYYGCSSGDVFVKGQLKGQVTIAAENFIWITGDLTYTDLASDILGLVGQNAIWVWNPIIATTTCSTRNGCSTGTSSNYLTDTSRTIDAAMLSVAHTFQVQNYDKGSSRGNLNVLGAIAQKFRGTVGTVGSSGTGYTKKYKYDVRLRNIAPPKFLQAVSTTYGVTQYAEVAAAFDSAGVPR